MKNLMLILLFSLYKKRNRLTSYELEMLPVPPTPNIEDSCSLLEVCSSPPDLNLASSGGMMFQSVGNVKAH